MCRLVTCRRANVEQTAQVELYFNRDRPILDAPLSVVAAALVSVLVFFTVKYGFPVDSQYALVAPLVSFLPGAMLTFGMVELAYGDMVSGSSRLRRAGKTGGDPL